jgi:membrane-associated phospholipid phosphatase
LALALLLFVFMIGCCFAPAQDTPAPPCHVGAFGRAVGRDSKTMLHGFASAPRSAIRPKNLAWELPVAAATGLLIAYGDRPTENRFQSHSLQSDASLGSDVGIALQLGAGGLAWVTGCATDHPTVANSAFTALVAAGFGQVINLGIKEGFRRQYPYQPNSTGAFFSRSRAGSFTSGHATTSFAFAAAIAHRYPHKPWVVWGSYALATGLSVARLPAKKHYASDILVGAAIGYATGTYLGDHVTP